jgi:hypothetical protein
LRMAGLVERPKGRRLKVERPARDADGELLVRELRGGEEGPWGVPQTSVMCLRRRCLLLENGIRLEETAEWPAVRDAWPAAALAVGG